jgi:endo-1,4-beta-xylanase
MLRVSSGRVFSVIAVGLTAAAVSGCDSPTEPTGTGGVGGSSAGVGGAAGSGGAMANGGSGGASGSGGAGAGGLSGAGGTAGVGGVGAAGSGGMLGDGGTSSGGIAGTATGGAAGASGGAGMPGGGEGGGMPGGGTSGAFAGTSGTGPGGAAGAAGGPAGAAGTAGTAGAPSCSPVAPGNGGTDYCTNTRGLLSSGYSYELWAAGQGSSGCMTVYGEDANYSASWTNASDFLVRAGLVFDRTQTHEEIGTISAEFAETFTEVPVQGATSKIYVALYGWTVEPLAEYYIIDDYGDFVPGPVNSDGSPRMNYGTITVDGGTYDIWAMPVMDRPAITGDNMDFTQIFSVRRERRKCGHISVSEHLTKWASLDLPLGKMEEAMFLMEAQNNSGTIHVTATVTLE